VQRRRSRKGGRRRKKRQDSQTQDVDPHSTSNEDGLVCIFTSAIQSASFFPETIGV
jgi:hypothetical protein